MRPDTRRIALVALVAGLALETGALAVAATAVRAAGPTLVATPSSGLLDGQYLRLSFTGFLTSTGSPDPFVVRQCKPSPANVASDCTDLARVGTVPVTPVPDSSGSGSFYAPVYAGSDPKLENAGSTGRLTCDTSDPCVLAAFPASNTTSDPHLAVLAPISFAPSRESCPAVGNQQILGSGSESAYRAVYAWQVALCVPPVSLPVGYVGSGDGSSQAGGADFFNSAAAGFPLGRNQFAITGPIASNGPALLGPDGKPTKPPPGLTYKYAPVAASAVVLAYRLYDNSHDIIGPQVTDLTLTPDQIAGLVVGNTSLNSPDIVSNNKSVGQFPSHLNVYCSLGHSEQTLEFTWWLSQNAPSWKGGATDLCPTVAVAAKGLIGFTDVGHAVLGLGVGSTVDPTIFFGSGNFGLMDWSTAQFYGLPAVNIKEPDGSLMVATTDSIEAALADATLGSDNTLAPGPALYSDTRAYQMTMPSYMMVPTNAIAPAQGAALATFLHYAVTDGQNALPPGYAPLPQNLVDASLQVVDQIPTKAAPAPTPTATPAPTATSSPAGSGSIGVGLAATPRAGGPARSLPRASPTPRPAVRLSLPANQGAQLQLVVQLAGGAGLVLPVIAGLGLSSLVLGLVVELWHRWRRPLGAVVRRLRSGLRSAPPGPSPA